MENKIHKNKLKALIVVHDNHQDSNTFPLGAGYIAAVLREQNVEVETYCMDVFHYTNEDLIEHLNDNNYDLVMAGFMVPRWRRTVRTLCTTIRENIDHNAWFILGGYGPSAIPEYIIEQTGADIIIVGEGELQMVDVVHSKRTGGKDTLDQISGIVYRNNGVIHTNPRRPKNNNLDSLPFPAWDLFPMDRYTTNYKFTGMGDDDRAGSLISTRGCTDKCSFCFRLEQGIRSRSPESVVEEMILLNKNYGINYYKFSDELAIISKGKILKLTNLIKQKLPGIHYRMDVRVSIFSDDIAFALRESGCVFLNIGFESSSQEVLDQMNKRVAVNQNVRAAEIAIKYGIGLGINMIWGMPSDNEKTLRDNAMFIKKYNQYDQIRTIRPVTPYPGSPLYYKAIAEGYLKGPQDFFDKFKNADRYMVNFMGMPEDKIYELLIEVNTDLILDHFNHTSGNMKMAYHMIDELTKLYSNEAYTYTGPRHYAAANSKGEADNLALRSSYLKPLATGSDAGGEVFSTDACGDEVMTPIFNVINEDIDTEIQEDLLSRGAKDSRFKRALGSE